jgi:Zn finger protein HypA/HybF involved in hydrogenase expression
MDGIRENEAVYGGSDYTERFEIFEYKCSDCEHKFNLGEEDQGCPECGCEDWEFSPGGVAFE